MKVAAHLYVNQNGSVRVTKGRGQVGMDEVVIALTIDVPNAYFQRPYPVVSLALPQPEPIPDPIIVKLTADTIAKAMKVDVTDVEDGLKTAVDRAREADQT